MTSCFLHYDKFRINNEILMILQFFCPLYRHILPDIADSNQSTLSVLYICTLSPSHLTDQIILIKGKLFTS